MEFSRTRVILTERIYSVKKKKSKKISKNISGPPVRNSQPEAALSHNIDTRKRFLEIIGQVSIIFVIMIVMVWGRAFYSQRKFYYDGEKALKEHNYKDAVTGYEWAIRMYTPFSGKVKDSCEKLWEIANEYERRGKLDWALITYRSLRSSIYAIQSLYTPYEEWIPRTDRKIESILALQKMQERRQKETAEEGS